MDDDINSELLRMRQALVKVLAVEKQLEKKLEAIKQERQIWEKRASIAGDKVEQSLSGEAAERVKQIKSRETELELELMSQKDISSGIKMEMATLECRRFGNSGESGAVAAADKSFGSIDRLESKIFERETLAELSSKDAERQARAEETKKSIEDELAALKAKKKNSN